MNEDCEFAPTLGVQDTPMRHTRSVAMPQSRSSNTRSLRVESLEPRRLLATYLRSAAADFYADFVGDLPQNNPNGDWAYLGPTGLTSELEAHDEPGSVSGSGTGWRVTAAAGGGPNYSYSRGDNPAFSSEPNSILGHGPMVTVWTAPAEVDLGAVELTGFITQADFESSRRMQMRIAKNNGAVIATVDADFVDQRAVVPLEPTQVSIEPGDTLTITVDGSGQGGTGVSTFASWDVTITEIDAGLGADFNGDSSVDGADLPLWEAGLGILGNAAKADGDADQDGNVIGRDLLIWQQQVGNSIEPPPSTDYLPAAVIVETTGVTLFDGSQLDVSGTQTHGLQEAFDYAMDEGWDVFVLPGTYNLDAGLDIEEVQGRAVRLEDVTMNFSSSVTDFGIRFDSTMIFDWYWQGGAINAPHAAHGVLFQPRTPHPLDGMKFGTKGVVDSRFDFGVDITAGTHEVTMNTLEATINDLSLNFKNVSEAELHLIGGGFAPHNVFTRPRTDDPIPFDLFSTAGRVTVVPPLGPIGGVATVYAPDGSKVSTTGTATSGLQEAFDFAGDNDLDVLVFGRGIMNTDPTSNIGLYNLNAGLTVDDLVDRTYRIYNVTFNYPSLASNAISLSDMINSDFELTGQVVAFGAANGVQVLPLSQGVRDSVLRVQHVVGSDTHVNLNAIVRTIEDSEFYFNELNIGDQGLLVSNPGSGTFFRNNFVRALHTHAMTDTGMFLGSGAINSENIHSNEFELRTSTDNGANSAVTGVSVWADNNDIDYIVLESGQAVGIRFETSSNDNRLVHRGLNATTPIIDLGVNNTCNGGSCPSALAAANSGNVWIDPPEFTAAQAPIGGEEDLPTTTGLDPAAIPASAHSQPPPINGGEASHAALANAAAQDQALGAFDPYDFDGLGRQLAADLI